MKKKRMTTTSSPVNTGKDDKSGSSGESPSPETKKTRNGEKFPIIAIGASAGGFEALENFLGNVPENAGIAIVIIQHLDPTHSGIMPELLQRSTRMKVLQVKDHMKIVQEHVYVIPPNKNMSLLRRALYLFEPTEQRGLRLPIDFFFRSLAADLQDQSIGIILSGMGSDGTLGIRAIKEVGGLVLVQDPKNAKFDGMPRSAVDTGLADIIAPASILPEKLMTCLTMKPIIKQQVPLETKVTSALEKIIILLRTHTGQDFSMYKKNTIYRRIERRMVIHQIDKIQLYVRYLQENPKEAFILFKELLIGVTGFFRDPQIWEHLRDHLFPGLIENLTPGRGIRAWVPACSTGEEAYSLAMIFREALDRVSPGSRCMLQIFATDLDNDAIEKARRGVYLPNIAADLSTERLNRFFVKDDHGFRVGNEIREMVIFATQNVIMDPPFTKLDILSCRNLLIYLDPVIQKKLIPLFHYSLNTNGILVLGTSETIGNQPGLFMPAEAKLRLFTKVQTLIQHEPIDFPTSYTPGKKENTDNPKIMKSEENLQNLADQLILQNYAPAAVLIREKGDILYVSGRTGNYLEPAAGKANWNIFAMAREGLRNQLPLAIHSAIREHSTVTVKNLQIKNNGGMLETDVVVQYLAKPTELEGNLLVLFREASQVSVNRSSPKKGRSIPVNRRIAELELELQKAREELSSTHEEMQTSQEELKSTNEELQSTNEELQSTNEELTTSKEEMQSLNEELQTVNAELQSKVDELSKASDDMKNLLDSIEIATVFLDRDLHIRRFTHQTTRIIKLIPGDIGRPLTDITTRLLYPNLTNDALEVLRTLVFKEKPVESNDGKWFNVRIMPYRTVVDKIEGLVITFTDITHSKKLEKELQKTIDKLKTNTSPIHGSQEKETGQDSAS